MIIVDFRMIFRNYFKNTIRFQIYYSWPIKYLSYGNVFSVSSIFRALSARDMHIENNWETQFPLTEEIPWNSRLCELLHTVSERINS